MPAKTAKEETPWLNPLLLLLPALGLSLWAPASSFKSLHETLRLSVLSGYELKAYVILTHAYGKRAPGLGTSTKRLISLDKRPRLDHRFAAPRRSRQDWQKSKPKRSLGRVFQSVEVYVKLRRIDVRLRKKPYGLCEGYWCFSL